MTAMFSGSDRPGRAEVLRLDGPLSLGLAEESPALVRGKEPNDLRGCVGTFSRNTSVLLQNKAVPADVHPLAEIEFPSKQARGKPIKVKVLLRRRC